MSEKKLIQLLQKKRGYFEAILDLTQEEKQLPIPDWIINLEQKRILLSCIDEVDEEIQGYQSRFVHLSQQVTDELDQIRQVVGKILHLDAANLEERKQQLDECK